jgi:hypothetical protein
VAEAHASQAYGGHLKVPEFARFHMFSSNYCWQNHVTQPVHNLGKVSEQIHVGVPYVLPFSRERPDVQIIGLAIFRNSYFDHAIRLSWTVLLISGR